jgi:D-psicose/D-tagatose/L-ribulose 3-epimerase
MHIRMPSARIVVATSILGLLAGAIGAAQAGRVLIGYCVGLRGLESAKAAGFDYVELGVTEIAGLSDPDFAAAVAHVRDVGIPTPNANLFLPGSMHLTGPQPTDSETEMAYVQKAFARLHQLGVTIVCFGSGGARRVPDGFDKAQAFQQLVDFGKRIAPEARANGITVVIEPLRRQESNIINSAAEGLALVNAINDPNFQLLIDFYHLASEKEDPAIILEAGPHLRHLHMANPTGRVFPLKWDEYDYTGFFASLRKIGYRGRMSIEASSQDLATEGPQAIALLRRAFAGEIARIGFQEPRPRIAAARRMGPASSSANDAALSTVE